MRISPRDKLILVAVAIAVVAVIAGLLLITPQLKTIATINDQIKVAEHDVDEANALLMQRQDMKDRAAQTDAAYLRLANQVPETPELPSLIIELQDIALQSGVEFEGLKPEDPISSTKADSASGGATAASNGTASEYVVIPMQVSVSGSWSDTIDFMNRLQHMTRAVRIVDYSSAVNNDQASGQDETASTATTEITNFKLEAYTVPVAATGNTASPSTPVPASNQ